MLTQRFSKHFIIVAVQSFLIMVSGAAVRAQLNVNPPAQVTARPGDLLVIPISLTNSAAQAIDAFGLKFLFPGAGLEYDTVQTAGTLTSSWFIVDGNQTGPNEITLGGFNTMPITTSGVLVNLKFKVKPGASSRDSLRIRNFADDLAGATTTDGVIDIVISIAQARAKANGEIVTVEGIVTRALGRFARLQDSTAGLTAFESAGAFRTAIDNGDVRDGDHLRITGVLSEFSALKEIAPVTTFQIISRGNRMPDIQKVNLAELRDNGEVYESELIRVDSLSINPAGDASFVVNKTYLISDASDNSNAVALRTPAGTDTRIGGVRIPAQSCFIGVLGQFSSADPDAGYQLQPVLSSDIRDSTVCVVEEREDEGLTEFALHGNYPNPFNPSTIIRYVLPKSAHVRLTIYNTLGEKIRTLVDGFETAGLKHLTWDGKNETGTRVASGVYLYRFEAGNFEATRFATLMK